MVLLLDSFIPVSVSRRADLRSLVFGGLFWAIRKHHFRGVSVCEATSYSRRGKPSTTIGAKELNFRVRYGNGCDLFAIVTSPYLVERLFSQNWITALKAFLLVKSSID
jgi:hypothetical protein